MSKWIVASAMNVPVHCYVQPDWTGQIMSRLFQSIAAKTNILIYTRTKEKLCSGELTVPGDQWPVFLYASHNYDPDDPWKGLFRSAILVSVSGSFIVATRLTGVSYAGIQAYIHITELRADGGQGYAVRQRANTWHDQRHARFSCLYSHSGMNIFLPCSMQI